MPVFQELFDKADGTKLTDVKLLMRIEKMPTEPVKGTSEKGTEFTYYPVQLSHQGQVYEWQMKKEQLERVFTNTTKDGKVTWRGQEGETVNVWLSTPKGKGRFNYYAAEPVGEVTPVATAQAAGEVFETPVPAPAATPAKPRFAKTGYNGGTKTEWDGTPRQSSFRQGLAGMLQALLSNPNIDPHKQDDINFVLALSDKMVKYVRVHAKELEVAITE